MMPPGQDILEYMFESVEGGRPIHCWGKDHSQPFQQKAIRSSIEKSFLHQEIISLYQEIVLLHTIQRTEIARDVNPMKHSDAGSQYESNYSQFVRCVSGHTGKLFHKLIASEVHQYCAYPKGVTFHMAESRSSAPVFDGRENANFAELIHSLGSQAKSL